MASSQPKFQLTSIRVWIYFWRAPAPKPGPRGPRLGPRAPGPGLGAWAIAPSIQHDQAKIFPGPSAGAIRTVSRAHNPDFDNTTSIERVGELQRMIVDFSVPCVPADLVMPEALSLGFPSWRSMQDELKAKAAAFASILSGVRAEGVPRHCNASNSMSKNWRCLSAMLHI